MRRVTKSKVVRRALVAAMAAMLTINTPMLVLAEEASESIKTDGDSFESNKSESSNHAETKASEASTSASSASTSAEAAKSSAEQSNTIKRLSFFIVYKWLIIKIISK